MNRRNQVIKLIHIAKRELGLDDETYRQMLGTLTGKTSCKAMRLLELDAVLNHLKENGFKQRERKPFKGRLSPKSGNTMHPEIDKIRALWIGMYKEGVVRDGSETELNNFVKRTTGIENVGWLDKKLACQLINTLKSWQKRTLKSN
ncbi:gp16 family protein [Thaumasiovibrio subtropicus]|uniref:gp16 family protein n=1 Tax=Thaumasiovibrio subtropicus TaxID=1891207 RepID=UPI000B34E86E|nr:regulatory protein GemA [Thaumasiovibrio subtropicus]